MKFEELDELHYISHIDNIPSIMKLGILSNHLAASIPHTTIAMEEIQDKRERRKVDDKPLHEYANLYFNARNPMLYKRKSLHQSIIILRINKNIMQERGIIISNRNASSSSAMFMYFPEGLDSIDKGKVFANYWTHSDWPNYQLKHKSIMCCEVLVPDKVDPLFIFGAYASNKDSSDKIREIAPNWNIKINSKIFFF